MNEILKPGKLPGLITYVVVILWFAGVLKLGLDGFYQTRNSLPISNLQLVIFTPMILFWVAYAILGSFRRYILSLDFLFLNLLQAWRVAGLGILLLWAYGMVPGGFGIPMSLLDASVGVIAVYVVFSIAHEKRGWRTQAWGLNIWGFLDFWVTISLALFSYKALPIDPQTGLDSVAALTKPPFSVFPSFAIPFFSCIHFAAVAQLIWKK